jgi:hypothetical protein
LAAKKVKKSKFRKGLSLLTHLDILYTFYIFCQYLFYDCKIKVFYLSSFSLPYSSFIIPHTSFS